MDDETNPSDEFAEIPEPGSSTGGSDTIVFVAVTALVGAAVAAVFLLDFSGWMQGKTNLLGTPRLEHYVERRDVESHSYRRIHAELFPKWLVAGGQSPEDWKETPARQAFGTLWNGIPDEKLRTVAADIWRYVAAREFSGNVGALKDLADRWNRRLTELEEPYFVRLNVAGRPQGSFVYGGFYRRLAEPNLRVGDREYRTLLLRRVDQTNLREMYLGASRHDGSYAFVIVDRIRDFARESVLPVVAAGLDEVDPDLDAVARAFAPDVRAALLETLGAETYATLETFARSHHDIRVAVESIRSRSDCSDFRITDPSLTGYPKRTLRSLKQYAKRGRRQKCPSVTADEARMIIEGTKDLRASDATPAFEALVAVLARGTAIHEVRHRADQSRGAGRHAGPPCTGCEGDVHPDVRNELSAYAASVSWSSTPALPLFQACRAASDSKGAHGRAVDRLVGHLDTTCNRQPPPKLAERAREVESDLFEHAATIELPDDFPDRVELGTEQ